MSPSEFEGDLSRTVRRRALHHRKEVLLGVIDVASDRVETPEEVAATIEQASRFVPVERIYPCTNCGMAPMDRSLALRKLVALSAGAAVARSRFESTRR